MAGVILECLAVGPLEANCYIITDTDSGEALVIDPGDDYAKIQQSVSKAGASVKYVVNTHGHVDHTGANSKFDAPVLIHSEDAFFIENVFPEYADYVSELPVPVTPGRLISDGDVIQAGAISLEVIHTPGHSPGGICLLWRRDGEADVVFAGDTIFQSSVGRSDLPGGSHDRLIASIREKILVLPDDTVLYTGHGPSTTVGAERRSNPFL